MRSNVLLRVSLLQVLEDWVRFMPVDLMLV